MVNTADGVLDRQSTGYPDTFGDRILRRRLSNATLTCRTNISELHATSDDFLEEGT